MKETTVRMHMNPEEALGTVGHVLEKEFRDKEAHVNPEGEFEVWINKGVYGVYKEVFGEAIAEYNQKQKRKDRRITDAEGDEITGYIKSIKNSKRGVRKKTVEKKLDDGTVKKIEITKDNGQRVLYELVVSAGNCNKQVDERGRVVYTEDGYEIHPQRMPREVNKRALKRFCNEFETAYPQLKIAICAYHADEQYPNGMGNYEWGIEHMHLNFIPVADGYTRGLSKQASITKALEQMGFKGGIDKDGVYRNDYAQFCADAQKRFEYILNVEYIFYCAEKRIVPEELVILHPVKGTGKKNLDPDAFRTAKELENQKRAVMADLVEIREQKENVEEEVVKAKKRLKKANTDAEEVVLDSCAVADEMVAGVAADMLQKRLEMDEEMVSMQLEMLKEKETAEKKLKEVDKYYKDKMQQADADFEEGVKLAKRLEAEANAYIEKCYAEYNSDFDKCKGLLTNIRNDIAEMQKEVEGIRKEDLRFRVDDELRNYLEGHCIVIGGKQVSLLDDFTEKMEEKKRKRDEGGNSVKKIQERVEDRLEGIDDFQKFLDMRCGVETTDEMEM